MPTLKDKTVFISGASRGIGRAIALRCARDGANVVVAAKTAEPNPKLEGTIYSVAQEIEAAGGRALPVQVDIREESAVQAAVEQAVKMFGGIDVLVNNASAIGLTGTLATPIKRFDLMHGINARGTFLCSQTCLPHLMRSDNPHILTLSPPLNLDPKWFAPHVAYSIAKYGMSLCTLGMAREFADRGVAVNSLWPRTTIATAAVAVFFPDSVHASRKPEIMADAAHIIITSDARKTTGNFFIDDEVLQHAGVTDLDRYAVTPNTPLHPDIFLD
ncbi:MAG: NAD(P)-dependent oxidoreductase [Betaproteobacteria bacterium]